MAFKSRTPAARVGLPLTLTLTRRFFSSNACSSAWAKCTEGAPIATGIADHKLWDRLLWRIALVQRPVTRKIVRG